MKRRASSPDCDDEVDVPVRVLLAQEVEQVPGMGERRTRPAGRGTPRGGRRTRQSPSSRSRRRLPAPRATGSGRRTRARRWGQSRRRWPALPGRSRLRPLRASAQRRIRSGAPALYEPCPPPPTPTSPRRILAWRGPNPSNVTVPAEGAQGQGLCKAGNAPTGSPDKPAQVAFSAATSAPPSRVVRRLHLREMRPHAPMSDELALETMGNNHDQDAVFGSCRPPALRPEGQAARALLGWVKTQRGPASWVRACTRTSRTPRPFMSRPSGRTPRLLRPPAIGLFGALLGGLQLAEPARLVVTTMTEPYGAIL